MIQRISGGGEPARQLAKVLGEALELVQGDARARPRLAALPQHPESLLAQCMALCEQARAVRLEPLRSLHQFARTGGTLVARCLASMPNVQLLSEVDPLSTMQLIEGEMRFAPTDFIQLLHQSSRGTSTDEIVAVFVATLSTILADSRARGQRLVIRDHSHSKYCCGEAISARPSVHALLAAHFDVRSAVLVRHPLDSFLSLQGKDWLTFFPRTIDEYAGRYLGFLDDHRHLPIFKYEAIVAEPESEVHRLCLEIGIPFAEGFMDRFDQFRLTGDNASHETTITQRSRRVMDDATRRQLNQAPRYMRLLDQLGYA